MSRQRLPQWFKVPLGQGNTYRTVRNALNSRGLHTVCSSARCPNLGECWNSGTATFLILGDVCTRNCGFCAISHGKPAPPDPDEPRRILEAVEQLELKYVVITSVTRDDLPDGGAAQFAALTRILKDNVPGVRVELLIPDFKGDPAAVQEVLDAGPDVLNHNIETVPGLYARFRPQADFRQSLNVLKQSSEQIGESRTKSGLMLGMGETRTELLEVFQALRDAGTGSLTLGQYLQPTRNHPPVQRYVPPSEFDTLAGIAREFGFTRVVSGPLIRSSYHAAESAATSSSI